MPANNGLSDTAAALFMFLSLRPRTYFETEQAIGPEIDEAIDELGEFVVTDGDVLRLACSRSGR